MIITDILDRFCKHLSWANEVDIATAWVTSNKGLTAIENSKMKVRTVVGLWGNQTDPHALTALLGMGELREPDTNKNFHPKIYIFRGNGKSLAWVGSANFTRGGFSLNDETVFETRSAKSVQNWFDNLWGKSHPLTPKAINDYAKFRKQNPPKPTKHQQRSSSDRAQDPIGLLREVGDWRSYVDALEKCDEWWASQYPWSVLGEQNSWFETVEVCHDLVSKPNWTSMNQYDRSRLLGIAEGSSWGSLGRMRPAALESVFGSKNCETIQNVIRKVVNAAEDAYPQLAFDSYAELHDIDGIADGVASRLLTVARPDRFVSVNNASRNGLASFFDFAPTTLGKPQNYNRLLTTIYEQGWFINPEPKNTQERAISQNRVALLDSFVYSL
ncbi:MAG: phospholipase D family protein [Gammaproteobacteria bacterium]|nr:phospholipase D family protein [Gammaproteobacteria bacterium]